MTASKWIVDKFYGKNVRFTQAENELRFVLQQNLVGSGTSIQTNLAIENSSNSQTREQTSSQNVLAYEAGMTIGPYIFLTRLTDDEISRAKKGNLSAWIGKPKKVQRKKNLPSKNKNSTNQIQLKKYNLRKRIS